VVGVIVIVGAEITSVYAFDALAVVPVVLSSTRTVKVKLPATVGVPESAPVDAFNVTPAGSAPAAIA
jgi:hypothetical protein